MRQASLVAFYGAKPPQLESFLKRCQEHIHQTLHCLGVADVFQPYALEQIHATVIGLERRTRAGLANRNVHAFRGCSKGMRLPQLFEFLGNCSYFPFDAQFGGFGDRDWPFQSRGARPYARSFSSKERSPSRSDGRAAPRTGATIRLPEPHPRAPRQGFIRESSRI